MENSHVSDGEVLKNKTGLPVGVLLRVIRRISWFHALYDTSLGMRLPVDVILVCIHWYAAYPLSYRHLDEIMPERGVVVDHSSINRRAIRFLPLLEKAFRKHKHAVSASWRMDETYIRVNGTWKYLIGQSTSKVKRSISC